MRIDGRDTLMFLDETLHLPLRRGNHHRGGGARTCEGTPGQGGEVLRVSGQECFKVRRDNEVSGAAKGVGVRTPKG